MKKIFLFILIQISVTILYLIILMVIRIFNIKFYATIDEYSIVGYFILSVCFFVYYLIHVLPKTNIYIGGILGLVMATYTFYIVGSFAFGSRILFDQFELITQCESQVMLSQRKSIYNGGQRLYIEGQGAISSDIEFHKYRIMTYEIELSLEQKFCLESAGYTVDFIDTSK